MAAHDQSSPLVPRIAWSFFHMNSTHSTQNATLTEILSTLGPVLGGLPGPGSIETHHGSRAHAFFTPTSFFLLTYVVLVISLLFKLIIRKTGSLRQLSVPLAFCLSRVLYWSLRCARISHEEARVGIKRVIRSGDFTVAFWVEEGVLLVSTGILLYSMMTLFADAMAGYQPKNIASRWLLKKWGTNGKLIETTSIAMAFPIPALSASAIRSLSKQPAKWAHWLTLWQASFHVFVIGVQVIALGTGWAAETPHVRINPQLSFQSIDCIGKERAKLFALTLLTGTYAVPVIFRLCSFLLAGKYHWMEDPGAFYTLFALPETLCVCLFLILPFKVLIPDPATLLSIDIPSLVESRINDTTTTTTRQQEVNGRRGEAYSVDEEEERTPSASAAVRQPFVNDANGDDDGDGDQGASSSSRPQS